MDNLFGNALVAGIFECALTLVITYALTHLLKYLMKRTERGGINHRFLANMVVAVVWVVGAMAAFSNIPGLSGLARTLLAGSGIVAVVVGLAAQDSFGNILSGMFLSLFRPFRIGDRIRLVDSNITGIVEDITLRHTVVRTVINNSRVIIPNSAMNSEIIENSNHTTTVSSNFVDISIPYESDLHLAMKLMADIIGSHELYLDQRTPADIAKGAEKVGVMLQSFGESRINLRACMWTRTVDENFKACSDARIRILEAFRENGIEIPYNRIMLVNENPRGGVAIESQIC